MELSDADFQKLKSIGIVLTEETFQVYETSKHQKTPLLYCNFKNQSNQTEKN